MSVPQLLVDRTPTSISISDERRFRFSLKTINANADDDSFYFNMPSRFIPLGTLHTKYSDSFGTLNGNELAEKNLCQIFTLFQVPDLLLMSLDSIDLSNFILQPGVYVPEVLAVDPLMRFTLLYLEPLEDA